MDALNPLALYQEDSLISSVSTDETKFAKLESEKIDEMSSANRTDRKNSEQLEMSFIEIKNRITPKNEPWITPIFKLEVFSVNLDFFLAIRLIREYTCLKV